MRFSSRIRIGALTTHADLLASEPLQELLPIFHQAAGLIADPQVRNPRPNPGAQFRSGEWLQSADA
jgi:FAD binding domain in molybdopterin dehydrogenase